MPDALDLTGEIASAIDGAALRGATPAVAYVRDDLTPAVSFRGSTQVHSPTELALWARKRDSGLAAAISARPHVSLVYYGGTAGPGPMFLSIEGRARVAPEIDDQVWAAMIDGERQQDPDRNGVAVLIEVDSVTGAVPAGSSSKPAPHPVERATLRPRLRQAFSSDLRGFGRVSASERRMDVAASVGRQPGPGGRREAGPPERTRPVLSVSGRRSRTAWRRRAVATVTRAAQSAGRR